MDSACALRLWPSAPASALLVVCLVLLACGPKVPPGQQLERLKQAAHGPVENRGQNRENSELVAQVLDSEVLMDMHRTEVASKLGKGELCQYYELCLEQGFEDDDWYYAIGLGDEAEVGKRPVLIVGFNRFGNVERVYQLRVH